MKQYKFIKQLFITGLLFLSFVAFAGDAEMKRAFQQQVSDLQVSGKGKVIRLLADDLKGSRHQKFIIRLDNQLSLLIAHNIDLAPRINRLKEGDWIEFYGEYEWNSKGGVVHWTHLDPNGFHVAGWLKHKGKKYQ